jgi:hypothetical protein
MFEVEWLSLPMGGQQNCIIVEGVDDRLVESSS